MSFFPQALLSSHPEQSSSGFTPLFRLLEDFDTYNRTSPSQQRITQQKTFTPKFDVKEEEDAYELHGELPGIEQKDIEVEFVDASTLSVRGKVEREYHSSSPTTPAVEGTTTSGALKDAPSNEAASEKSHQPTVSDENDESKTVAAPASANGDPQKSVQQQKNATASEQKPSVRYWTSERTYGSFARTFTFPENIDQNAVTASMKNGVLSIRVPKAPKHQPRRRIAVL